MTLKRRSLTIAAIRSAPAAGRRRRLFDGGNLVLPVYANGRASWLFRYSVGRSKREMGLGAYDPANRDGLSLVAAREAADEWRAVLRRGLDPIEERRRRDMRAAGGRTFRETAEVYLDSMLPRFRNPKHRQQWRSTLRTYAFPVLGNVPVNEVEIEHVLRVLTPIWHTRTETAVRFVPLPSRALARGSSSAPPGAEEPAGGCRARRRTRGRPDRRRAGPRGGRPRRPPSR